MVTLLRRKKPVVPLAELRKRYNTAVKGVLQKANEARNNYLNKHEVNYKVNYNKNYYRVHEEADNIEKKVYKDVYKKSKKDIDTFLNAWMKTRKPSTYRYEDNAAFRNLFRENGYTNYNKNINNANNVPYQTRYAPLFKLFPNSFAGLLMQCEYVNGPDSVCNTLAGSKYYENFSRHRNGVQQRLPSYTPLNKKPDPKYNCRYGDSIKKKGCRKLLGNKHTPFFYLGLQYMPAGPVNF